MTADPLDLTYGHLKPDPTQSPETAVTLPGQDVNLVLLLADRWNRASAAMTEWSDTAKKSVEYFENKQWDAKSLAQLHKEGRPGLTINKIKPLVNLVLGYHIQNLTDIRYNPGHDGTGSAATAGVLTHMGKQASEINGIPYVDAEVYLDGLLTGRGFWDTRLSFENNDLGELTKRAQDNFATYLDPDGQDYDINTGNYVMTSRWTSVDEIEYYFGKDAAVMVGPWIAGGAFSGVPLGLYDGFEELTPWRRFGGEENVENNYWQSYFNQFWDWVDRQRQSIRLIDVQHYVRVKRWFFIDLETGDRVPVPDHWDGERVKKALFWAADNGSPMVIQPRLDRRLRHTIMIGDVIVYDRWSPYRTFTITPFFPYFRRGRTKGMVEDLLDPQDEINKRRSSWLNIVNRTANGGWMYEKGSLDPKEQQNLELNGSSAGLILGYDTMGGALGKPEQIQPMVPPTAMQQLEDKAEGDIKEIAGINDAALGQLEAANASGRALESRQRGSLVGVEGYQQNWRRSKELNGRKDLELFQTHYTEQRIIRITGQSQFDDNRVIINQQTAEGIVNNVTLGKYAVSIDESPLSVTFLEAQFNEMLRLMELGFPLPDEWLIDASSMPRKDELKLAIQQMRADQAAGLPVPQAEGGRGAGSPTGALPTLGVTEGGGPVVSGA